MSNWGVCVRIMWRSATSALAAVVATVVVAALTTATASAGPVLPEIWAGSPVSGTWNSDARSHHWLANASDQGDWATDIAVAAGTPVVTYIAPQNGGYDVTTRVDQIGAGCRSGDGAGFVTVGVYASGTRVGSVTYGHVRPGVAVGQWISRWGATIGTVAGGLPVDANCWTGPHIHLQMFNVSKYSCFNRGYGVGSVVDPSNFVGFTGGNRVGGPRQPCP